MGTLWAAGLRRLRAAGAAAVLLAVATASPARAHTQNGSLGTMASATDLYHVTCSDDGSGPPGSSSGAQPPPVVRYR